ncbi:CID domain-containing protein [Artemisia annua]|uniref:CID domain-containing protein n=1 Tax=Artemisia annua TaxID=35608 RepID=A0A2U1NRB5_ARTAN|nr:CID domain-containing protein [Artemisia annua]
MIYGVVRRSDKRPEFEPRWVNVMGRPEKSPKTATGVPVRPHTSKPKARLSPSSLNRNPTPFTSQIPIPQPELKGFPNKTKPESVLPASKWAREDDENDDEQKRSTRDLGLGYSSSGSENAAGGHGIEAMDTASTITSSDSSLTEEKRQKLRQIEVSLIEYRESLEERGLKKEEIEKKVVAHQKQLQYKYDAGLFNKEPKSSTQIQRLSTRATQRPTKLKDYV